MVWKLGDQKVAWQGVKSDLYQIGKQYLGLIFGGYEKYYLQTWIIFVSNQRKVVHGIGPNWYQVGTKTCHIPKVCKFYVEKEYLC